MENKKKIMFLGTGSDVGKSVTAAAFCRILKNRGYRVAPFKAQNMSNNSYVTLEGCEIGRAQAVQAEACGIEPSVHMNPVLLKPNTDLGAQVVVHGMVMASMTAKEYYRFKEKIKEKIMESHDFLHDRFQAIVMEGAGSCAEVNLKEKDLVNFSMAKSAGAPVVLVADIDRGGVFAQIIGTMAIIEEEEREMVKGFIINKFRGDPSLFKTGIHYLEEKTGKPVFGLVPMFKGFKIDSEDSMSLDRSMKEKQGLVAEPGKIYIGAVRLPHVSNFTDLEVLADQTGVVLNWIDENRDLDQYDALILPGTKNTIGDTEWLRKTGLMDKIRKYGEDRQNIIVGLCGGFQILGREINDPKGLEGKKDITQGIGLLDISTELGEVKILRRTSGKDKIFNAFVSGYEIHMGITSLGKEAKPFLSLKGEGTDGAVNPDGNVFGTYLHGLFDTADFRKCFLSILAANKGIEYDSSRDIGDYRLEKDKNYNLLASHFEKYLDVESIIKVMN